MRRNYEHRILLFFALLTSLISFSQQNYFTDIIEQGIARSSGQRSIVPEKYRNVALDRTGMHSLLWSLPLEKALATPGAAPIIVLPLPDGTQASFHIWESPVMEPALASKFPTIKTFAGQGIEDPASVVRLDYTEHGFHAMILSAKGDIFIDPYQQADLDHYIVYNKKDLRDTKNFQCLTVADLPTGAQITNAARENLGPCTGAQLRTFRLALACTAEYSTAVSNPATPTLALVMSAMTTSVNRVTGVYEREVGVRLVLIANNQNLIYFDAATDPYTNNDGSAMLSQNQSNIDAVIGATNYDIGHVFSTGGGGIASLAVPCTTGKARGVTGLTNPTGDPFDIDYVAHEMGHQFSATHTFNAVSGSCSGNRSAGTAAEPGSGVTIMAYAGICGAANNLAPNSIAFFHGLSFDQISTFVSSGAGAGCAVVTATGNAAPTVNAGANFTIPVSTPFVLTGSATDPNGDALTYSWEQVDVGPQGNWNTPTGNAPLFRSFVPVATGTRYFPKLSDQIGNTTTIGELLPSYARSMAFRLTARDNRAGGGGVCSAEMQIAVDATSGPFVVTIPSNTGISWAGNSTQVITWNVANTTAAPVSAANVSIELSLDGGLTFPTVLIASTPNDGTEAVTLPATASTTARIRVKAVGNVFYDISNNNFTISAPLPGFDFNNPAAVSIPCGTAATATATLGTISNLGYTTPITLSASGAPTGTSVSFATNPVTPGNDELVTLNNANTLPTGTYTVTIQGVSGSITRTRVLTFTVPLGAGPVITSQPQSKQVCDASPVVFRVVTSTPVLNYQWQQSTDQGVTFIDVSGEVLDSLKIATVTPSQSGYQYRVVLTGKCNITTSGAATLTVYALPKVQLNAAPSTSLLPGQQTNLTAVITPGSTPTITATWFVNNTSIGQVTNNVFSANVITGLGAYQVRVLDANGCAAQSATVTLTAQASTRLFIYPSPNKGQFTVAYYNSGGGATRQSVAVFDSHGQKLYLKVFDVTGPYQLLPIDIRTAATGVYYVVIGDANGRK